MLRRAAGAGGADGQEGKEQEAEGVHGTKIRERKTDGNRAAQFLRRIAALPVGKTENTLPAKNQASPGQVSSQG